MPRLRRNEIVEIDEFTIQARTYSDTELRDFHNKTQRFYKEKREESKQQKPSKKSADAWMTI